MSNIIKKIKQYDGISFFKQMISNHLLYFTIINILLFGFSKKGLEITRSNIEFKMYKKLYKKYAHLKDNISFSTNAMKDSDYVWICWLQGIENAPYLVKCCYQSVLKYFPHKHIVVITQNNYSDYIDIPQYIIEKWKKGIITHTHFSDILRTYLLCQHGGTWIDATVWLSSDKIPEVMYKSDLFVFQELKPARDAHTVIISSWYIHSKAQHPILMFVKEMIEEYWKYNKKLCDYFLFHYFFTIACNCFPEYWNNVPRFSNSLPHILLLELFNEYSESRFTDITNLSSIHKLSYKFDQSSFELKNTFYDKIFEERKTSL